MEKERGAVTTVTNVTNFAGSRYFCLVCVSFVVKPQAHHDIANNIA
jgi:hypothetical protein